MTQPPTDPTPHNPAELARFLRQNGLDLSTWGHGSAKTIDDLFRELQTGECQLQVRPLRRLVEVASLLIQRGDRILLEANQTLEDGRTRQRNRYPSEKRKPGETLRQTAERCLIEELGLAHHQFRVSETHSKIEEIEAESPSYPGLITIYGIYTFEAKAPSLPDEAFETIEEGEENLVRVNRWEWEKSKSER